MIPYEKSFLGISLIFRLHGSPIWRAAVPAFLSTLLFVYIDLFLDIGRDKKFVTDPDSIGVLISSISFLIVFRANYGYQRYWNACGDVHQMMSKWLDAITHAGCYHMQQHHFDHIKPPSYFNNHDLNKLRLSRDREKEEEVVRKRLKSKTCTKDRAVAKSIEQVDSHDSNRKSMEVAVETTHLSIFLLGNGRRDGGWGDLFQDNSSTYFNMKEPDSWMDDDKRGFASIKGGRTHSLFLQELIHLCSLCNAVAFCTLRNDIDGAESPLNFYQPGAPWPKVDPDSEGKTFKKSINDILRYLSGFDKTPTSRTRQNASRPLPVLGGVSDNEIAFLQKAKGASAKVNLAWHWLSEFIIREQLAGSLGDVGPPIISRIFQFLSDGMVFYNHARKVMFIPFPFPHAQISAFFVFTIMFTVPLLMLEYSNNTIVGGFLTFLTVTCLAGLHEVARELENPFRNVPNEIPLCTLQAQFNEALIVLYSGYHPDHFWDGNDYREDFSNSTVTTDSIDAPQAPLKKTPSALSDSSDKSLKLKELQTMVHQQQ